MIFHGRQSGEALKKLYAQAYLGVDVLGGHRKNYPVSSSLKSREYAAYGLPILTSSPVDYLPHDYKYQLLVSYDDNPVDIQFVLDFFHNIYENADSVAVSRKIRVFAESRCDMSITMKSIIV